MRRSVLFAIAGALFIISGILYTYIDLTTDLAETVRTAQVKAGKTLYLVPPAVEVNVEVTITNPTNTRVIIESLVADVFYEDVQLGALGGQGVSIQPHGNASFRGSFNLPSNLWFRTPYTIRVTGKITASVGILSLKITREYPLDIQRAQTSP